MKLNIKKSNKGVTLIELVIVIALIGIVLSVIYSLYFFSQSTYSQGENQYELQTEARLAFESLTQDLRFVREIEIIDNHGSETAEPYETILYYDTINNQVVKNFAGTTKTYRFNTSSSNPLVFKKTSNNTIYYKLSGQEEDQNYVLESDITLLNVTDIDVSNLTDTTNLTGKAILFKTPEAFLAQSLAPSISLPDPNLNTAAEIKLIYNQPVTAYLENIDIIIESDASNMQPLTNAEVTLTRTAFGLESIIELDLDLTNVTLLSGERIILTIYDSTEVDSDGNSIPQHLIIMAYNPSTTTWDLQN